MFDLVEMVGAGLAALAAAVATAVVVAVVGFVVWQGVLVSSQAQHEQARACVAQGGQWVQPQVFKPYCSK